MRPIWTIESVRAEIMRRYNLLNNNQFCVKCDIDPSVGIAWSRGQIPKKPDHIRTLALLLEEDAGYLAHCLNIQREHDATLAESMRRWLMQHGTAAVLVLSVFTASAALPADAVAASAGLAACILCQIARRLFGTPVPRSARPTGQSDRTGHTRPSVAILPFRYSIFAHG